MTAPFIENRNYQDVDFRKEKLAVGEYEICQFKNCIFSELDLAGNSFTECEFINCDFSNAIGKNIIMREVIFKNCKLLGFRFDQCDPFLLSFSFEDCFLNFTSFYKLKIKRTKFLNCIMQQSDLSEADLSSSHFDNCDMQFAIFQNTNLTGANFLSARNFIIDPEENLLKGAKFSSGNLAGLLTRHQLNIL